MSIHIVLNDSRKEYWLADEQYFPRIEKDVELFFNRFYTADQTRSGKGTGLGLSIAKALMDKMNGKLSAELKDSIRRELFLRHLLSHLYGDALL